MMNALNVYEWMTDLQIYDMQWGMEGMIWRSKVGPRNYCVGFN